MQAKPKRGEGGGGKGRGDVANMLNYAAKIAETLKGVLQCGAVWCSVVQCVAVCCSVLQCDKLQRATTMLPILLRLSKVCCSVVQCVAVVMQCVVVCCIVLQCVAAWCSVVHRATTQCCQYY